jgi:YVTN family beta-propeller protein
VPQAAPFAMNRSRLIDKRHRRVSEPEIKVSDKDMNRIYSLKARALWHAPLLWLALVVGAQAQVAGPQKIKQPTAGPAPSVITQRVEKEGIAVEFSLATLPGDKEKQTGLVAGADAIATLRLTDARTGQPVAGIHPYAWFSARTAAAATDDAGCRDKIRTFMGGLLSARADIDLNGYLLVTLNHDRTITFTNPQIAFSRTKLESIVTLPGNGADWVLARNKEHLYVTLPEQSAVAVVNTVTRKLVSTIAVGEKFKPMRIALEPGGNRVWVGLDGAPFVAVIDTKTNQLLRTVGVGGGLHNIAFTPDERFAYVTNSADDTVTAVDTKTLTKVADIAVGKTPVPVAYSTASRLLYVSAINGGTIAAIDPARQQTVATIPVNRGVVALQFEPRGRFGFAVNQLDSTVSVFDSATNKIVGSVSVVKSPDQVVFTGRYAYVRGTASEKFSLIELDRIGKDKLSAVDVQAGQQAATARADEIGVANMIAPTPEGNSVVVANTPDMMMYFYVEGMMAPMGTLNNYKRRPHGLLVIDRSLAEVAPGTYSTPVKLQRGGAFDVPILINETKITHCFQADIAGSPDGDRDQPRNAVEVVAAFAGQQFKPGTAVPLRFKLTDAVTKQPLVGLADVQILVFEPPGISQQRQWAKEIKAGEYEVMQTFPHAGAYNVMVRIGSRGVGFADLPFTSVVVSDNSAAAAKPDKE